MSNHFGLCLKTKELAAVTTDFFIYKVKQTLNTL